MAERVEEPEAEIAERIDQIDPAAVSIALGRAAKGGKGLDAEAAAFLRDQRRLIGLQTEHLHEQRLLVLSRLKWGRFNDRLKGVLQLMTAFVGMLVAAGVVWMAWQAHEARGLIVEPFTVPPDLAAQGLTGQAVAGRVLDGVKRMQDQTVSPDSPKELEHSWGQEARVEIPETGVSIGELQHLLREWLGHEIHVSGELTHSGTNLTLTLRTGPDPGEPLTGPDPDALIAKAAEEVYGAAQPARFASWLVRSHRVPEAIAVDRRLSLAGSRQDRARALHSWASALTADADVLAKEAESLRLDATSPRAWSTVAFADQDLGRSGPALRAAEQSIPLWSGREATRYARWYINVHRGYMQDVIAGIRQDPLAGARVMEAAGDPGPDEPAVACQACAGEALLDAALDYAQAGDGAASRRAFARAAATMNDPKTEALGAPLPGLLLAEATGDWPRIALALRDPQNRAKLAAGLAPWAARATRAEALAAAGRMKQAEAMANGGAAWCYECAVDLGRFAALAGDWTTADAAFARAVGLGPELPRAHLERARMLIARGRPDAAVAELETAVRLGPHSARARELWGEALLAKRDFAGAAAKFAEADPDAPRWGHDHLLWGEALMLSGRYAEARAQFETTAGLDLNGPDRAALEVLLARTASGPLHG